MLRINAGFPKLLEAIQDAKNQSNYIALFLASEAPSFLGLFPRSPFHGFPKLLGATQDAKNQSNYIALFLASEAPSFLGRPAMAFPNSWEQPQDAKNQCLLHSLFS
jgi:hypothetical protein